MLIDLFTSTTGKNRGFLLPLFPLLLRFFTFMFHYVARGNERNREHPRYRFDPS